MSKNRPMSHDVPPESYHRRIFVEDLFGLHLAWLRTRILCLLLENRVFLVF